MIINIPDFKKVEIKNLICDYNGTLANNGKLINGVEALINKLAKSIKIYVITADTFGSVEAELKNANCTCLIIGKDNQSEQKLSLVEQLGPNNTVSFGNGRNDELMIRESLIGVGILEGEGIYTKSLLASDIICKNIYDAFELFLTPNKVIATLRN